MAKKSDAVINLYMSSLSEQQGNIHCRWATDGRPAHRHTDFYEFGLIYTESLYNEYRNSNTELGTGTLFLFDVGKTHELIPHAANGKALHFTMCVAAPYFQLLTQTFFPKRTIFPKSGFLKCKLNESEFHFMCGIANTLMTKTEADPEKSKLFIYNALHLLLETPAEQQSASDQIVDDILQKIRNYTYLTCSIQDIYDQYPYSAATLIKMFKQRTGETIIRFQTNTRLDCAARFLRETNQSVEQIAANLGFISVSYFFRIFKEHYGMTPNAYRAHAREYPNTDLSGDD